MTEKQTKKLVQQSILKTSDAFTDQLMSEIEIKKKVAEIPLLNFRMVLFGVYIFSLIMSFMIFKLLTTSNISLTAEIVFSKTSIISIVSLIILIFINYVVKLDEVHRYLKSES